MIVLIPLILLVFLLLFRYMLLYRREKFSPEAKEQIQGGLRDFPEKLSRMISIPTISWTDEKKMDARQFKEFQDLLPELFPLVHQKMDRKAEDPFSILYKWQGTDKDAEAVLFLAHYDVVPALEEGNEKWHVPPFSGLVKDGFLWGRGSLDMKSHLAMLLESAETLISEGFQPQRTLFFAFGADEEVSGVRGAGKIAARFREEGKHFAMIHDEGGIIALDSLKFLKGKAVALLGLAEKGFVSVKITARGESGHSSMPQARGTVIDQIARGILKIGKRRQPARLTREIRGMLESFVPHVSPLLGILFANLWLTGSLVLFIFSKNHSTDSLIRTTQAFTVARAGEQENVIPPEAHAIVNHRILPGDSMAAIMKRHEKKLLGMNLSVEKAGNWPSNNPVTGETGDDPWLRLFKDALGESYPDLVISPFIVNAATDSRHYKDLSKLIIRFSPLWLKQEDINSIHGVNEKISLENLNRGLIFFRQLFRKL